MAVEVAALVCTCGHDQADHGRRGEPIGHVSDPTCLGFHDAGHGYASDTAYGSGWRGCSCEGFTLAGPVEPDPFRIPDGWQMLGLGVCRSCGHAIAWCLTRNDKRAPIDRDGTSHFATCPSADAWRRRR